jgi:hypothetical protein
MPIYHVACHAYKHKPSKKQIDHQMARSRRARSVSPKRTKSVPSKGFGGRMQEMLEAGLGKPVHESRKDD